MLSVPMAADSSKEAGGSSRASGASLSSRRGSPPRPPRGARRRAPRRACLPRRCFAVHVVALVNDAGEARPIPTAEALEQADLPQELHEAPGAASSCRAPG